jgi:hypothetical protein
MKKNTFILFASLFASPALAASSNLHNSLGVNYSFDNVLGAQFEFDLSKAANAPISAQLFWKSYSQRLGTFNTWNTRGVGVAGIYDLTAVFKSGKKIHPYLGAGLISVSHTWAGSGSALNYTGVDSGLYITGGVRYNLNSQVDADLNANSFGGLTAGVNFNF